MSILHGFELIREQTISELNTHGRLFRHLRTGAELLSLENENENKVFGINFRTIPSDSTGIAHIMEHSVLAGSEKFPVKEPFVELLKGSLKTFVNAFTFPDKTCYPAASQNLQDFYNLIDVYMDAVFHPLLPEHILDQEGWHYELDNPDDPIIYKGVVFNEMKGAYSDPNRILNIEVQRSLFPGHLYALSSGGDPKVIPELTYEQFKRFHETFYHPSNAFIYFYGDDDPEERLQLMNSYLEGYDAIDVNSAVHLHTPIEKGESVIKPFAASDQDTKSYLAINWLLPDQTDPEAVLGFTILDHILLGSPAAPLRKALIDSGLGEDLTSVGLENDLRQLFFSTGLKGIDRVNADEVENLIDKTLAQLVEHGIDPDTVAASVNTIEFRLRENNTGMVPQGLFVMLRALRFWLYDHDPLAQLAFEAPLTAIKDRLGKGEKYFEWLINDYLIENQHRTRVLLIPDPALNQQEETEERRKLAKIQAGMSAAEIEKLIAKTQKLKAIQSTPDTPEALATIPTLTLDDIDKTHKPIPVAEYKLSGGRVLFHELPTNGILYLDLGFDLHTLPQEYLPFAGLFGRALLEMGTQAQDFVTLTQRIGRETGGIRPSLLTMMKRETNESVAYLFWRGKSTFEQTTHLLSIFKDVLLTADLDNQERFLQIVLEEKARREAGLVPSGHLIVNSRLKSKLNVAGWVSEQTNGLAFLFFLRKLAEQVENDWPNVLAKLEMLQETLLGRNKLLCNVTVDGDAWPSVKSELSEFVDGLPANDRLPSTWAPDFGTSCEGLSIPAQVNYVGKGGNLYDLGYNLHGSISVINKYLGTTWLWEKIRVQGGAYGGFSTFDPLSGAYNFLSYRDPNLLGSLANFDATGQFLRDLDLSSDELLKSIIGAIGTIDAYMLPDAKGYTSMQRVLANLSDDFLQKYRDEVLSTTQTDFKAFSDVMDAVKEDGHVVVLGAQESIRAADDEMGGGWIDIQRVM
jgi:Zn-dependent M16 (insulinase) family peptidase